MQANYAFHDVIYAVRRCRSSSGSRRVRVGRSSVTASGAPGAELDELYAKNDLQHRAIREAIAAGSAAGARLLAREHVLSSGRLIEIVIESVGGGGRDPGWGSWGA